MSQSTVIRWLVWFILICRVGLRCPGVPPPAGETPAPAVGRLPEPPRLGSRLASWPRRRGCAPSWPRHHPNLDASSWPVRARLRRAGLGVPGFIPAPRRRTGRCIAGRGDRGQSRGLLGPWVGLANRLVRRLGGWLIGKWGESENEWEVEGLRI